MSKRMTKVLSMILTLVMFLSVSTPAFAWGNIGIGDGWDRDIGEDEVRDFDVDVEEGEEEYDYFSTFDEETGINVTVEAPLGALPTLAEVRVQPVDPEQIRDAVDSVTGGEGEILVAMDISFWLDYDEIEPEEPVRVRISAPELEGRSDLTVVHIPDEEEPEAIDLITDEEDLKFELGTNEICFESGDFSVYAVIGGEGATKLLTVNFYDQNGQKINTQLYRFDQVNDPDGPVFDPGVPTITDTQSFEGWTTKENYTPEDTGTGLSVAEINTYIKETYGAGSETDVTLDYYPMVYDVFYVIYHDQAGAVLKTESVIKPSNAASVEVTVNYAYVAFLGGQHFAGWTPDILDKGDNPTYTENPTVYANNSKQNFSQDIRLYPYIETGYWLTFDNNIEQDADTTTASYTSPVFYKKNVSTSEPETPTRTGYEFGGWYVDADMTTAFDFGATLTEDTTIYAKWIPQETTYRVTFWQQMNTDPVDAADADKTYSHYTPTAVTVVRTAHTGNQVSITEADTRLGNRNDSTTDYGEMGFYFVYNANNSDTEPVTVKGDGSTVLNVYYDRKTMTISFYTASNKNTLATLAKYEEAENGGYYYYPYTSGYYLIGTGPNADAQYSYGTTVYYHDSYTSSNLPSYDNVTKYYSSGMSSHTLNSNNNYQSWSANENTLIYQYTSWGTTYYRPLYYQFTSQGAGYYAVGTGPDPTAAGTHNRTSIANPMTGLYGAPLPNWPDEPEGQEWAYDDAEDGKHYGITVRDSFNIPDNKYTTTWDIYGETPNWTSYKMIHWMIQDLNGNYEEKAATKLGNGVTQYYDNGKFMGFKAKGHNLTTNSTTSGFVAFSGSEVGIGYSDAGNDAYIYFDRRSHNLEFVSMNQSVRTEQVLYEKPLSEYSDTVPENGEAGYYFDGWYADPGFDTEFDFSQEMPNHQVTVYAKWTLTRYRIVLDPTGGDENVDPETITFPGNQVTTFRVDYGEKVQGSSINNAEREGYNLLGWYLDPEYTIPFNFDDPITDQVQNMDMDYANAPDEERQGTDPWNDENPTYTDVGRANVRGKLVIYARWREDPKGTIGMNVEYDAMDGLFSSNNSKTWEDPFIYVDHAEAFAQPASTPNNSNLQFLYWEIMKPTSEDDPTLVSTGKKVYPGQTWEVLLSDAVVTEVASTGDGTNGLVLDPANLQRLRSGNVADTMAAETETNTLLTEGFENMSSISTSYSATGWFAYNAGRGNTWTLYSDSYYANNSSKCAQAQFHENYAADCYLISAPFTVDANALTLSVSLFERVAWSYLTEQFEVFFVKDSDVTNGSVVSATHYTAIASANYTNTTYAEKNGSVSAADLAGQDVRLVIHCTSARDQGWLFIDDISVTEEVTVAPSTVTVTFDANGGSGSMDSQIVPIGVLTSLNENKFTHFGYVFAGWSTEPGEAEVVYADKEEVNIDQDLTLYAQWTMNNPHTLTVKYVGPEGDTDFVAPADHVEQVPEGARFRVVSPEVEGYRPNPSLATGRMGSEDMVVTVTYVKDTNQRYTVYLHAVYGKSNTSNMTHITWYANNGTGEYMQSTNVRINETISIPVPSAMVTEGKPYVAWNATNGTNDLIWEDHVFLGWARVNESTMEGTEYWNTASDHPWEIELGEDDLFLKYDPVNKTFLANNSIESTDIQPVVSRNYVLFGYINGRNYSCEEYAAERSEYRFDADGKLTTQFDEESYVAVKETNGTEWFMTNGWAGDVTSTTLYNTSTLGTNGNKLKVPGGVPVTFTLVENEDGTLTLSYKVGSTAGTNSTGTVGPKAADDEQWFTVDYVAADEQMPYHAMYAVWGKVVYVYHTGTGVVERIVVADNTLDVADRTTDGFLYGGYYKSYAGQGASFNVKTTEWLTPSEDVIATMSKESQVDASKGWLSISSDSGCTTYDGVNISWDSANAFGKAEGEGNGLNAVPVAGTTYYIKEVPADKYLQPYFHYTYKKIDGNPIVTAWLISDLDDENYTDCGFVITDKNGEARICSSLKVTSATNQNTITLTPQRIFGSQGVTGGLLTYRRVMNEYYGIDGFEAGATADGVLIHQYWVTPDGLIVTGTTSRTYTGISAKGTVKCTSDSVTSNIAVYDKTTALAAPDLDKPENNTTT